MPYSIPLNQRVQLRRDTSVNWTSGNPVLKSGEIGYETDTGKIKVGNGSTEWTGLSYLGAPSLGGLQDVIITDAANGDFLRWNGTAWINDAVNLSTDTVGSYVQSLVAGSAITITNNSGEAATPTIAVTTNTFEAYGAASSAVSAHEADTTNIHGIANTSLLVTTTGTQTLTNKTIASPTFTGTVSGISVTATQVGLGNVDNTSDANKPVSTAGQTALNLKADIDSPTFTGTPAAPTAAVGTSTTQIATTGFVIATAEDAQFILAGQIF